MLAAGAVSYHPVEANVQVASYSNVVPREPFLAARRQVWRRRVVEKLVAAGRLPGPGRRFRPVGVTARRAD